MSASLPSFDQYDKKRMEFISKWTNNNNSDSERLFTLVVVEKIFFGCGVKHSVDAEVNAVMEVDVIWNAQTDALHYLNLVDKLTNERAHEIVRSAVEIQKEFADLLSGTSSSFLSGIIGMNTNELSKKIEHAGDHVLSMCNHQKLFQTTNSFFGKIEIMSR